MNIIGSNRLAIMQKNLMVEIKCPSCNAPMVLRQTKADGSLFYGCSNFPECRETHGAHRDGRPLGIPGDKETRELRIKAHDLFDKLWREYKFFTRKNSYLYLQRIMNLSEGDAHIGKFDKENCKKLIGLLENPEERMCTKCGGQVRVFPEGLGRCIYCNRKYSTEDKKTPQQQDSCSHDFVLYDKSRGIAFCDVCGKEFSSQDGLHIIKDLLKWIFGENYTMSKFPKSDLKQNAIFETARSKIKKLEEEFPPEKGKKLMGFLEILRRQEDLRNVLDEKKKEVRKLKADIEALNNETFFKKGN